MGRWAQRRRGGGGSPTLNQMINVTRDGDEQMIVTYRNVVNVSDLQTSGFLANPGAVTPPGVTQLSPTQLTVDFEADTSAFTTLVYAPPTSGFVAPQQITIT